MRVEDMVEKIDFHDSGVMKVYRRDDVVILQINLCMWRQEGYKEGEEELKEIFLQFESIKDYNWDSKKTEAEIDYETILKVTYSGGTLEMILEDAPSEISIISFKCNTVELV